MSSNPCVRRLDVEPAQNDNPVSPVSDMLRLFRQGVRQYQPEGLARESGDPQVALENVHLLLARGCVIEQILVRPTGTLFTFTDGSHFYTSAFRVGGDGRETEALAELAHASQWGPLEELLDFYHAIDPDYEGPLPDLLFDTDDLRSERQAMPIRLSLSAQLAGQP